MNVSDEVLDNIEKRFVVKHIYPLEEIYQVTFAIFVLEFHICD
jgi:hypothetical protein